MILKHLHVVVLPLCQTGSTLDTVEPCLRSRPERHLKILDPQSFKQTLTLGYEHP